MSSRSNRRGRRSPLSPSPGADATPAEQQVVAADEHELVSRLCALLPPEVCVYIRRLHAEVDGLAERLARLLEDDPLAAVVVDGTDAGAGATDELIRNRLM
ncbi:transcription factor ILI2-like [Miscanthus floridulus]|uniref:transcription factor ILI2-like n=1 Tax=Miscanthus floridulus TaxID=154761 RepID=UPI00345A817A